MAVTSAGRALRPRSDALARFVGWLPRVAVAVPLVLWSVGFDLPERYRFVPLIASVVVFGLPHGALDHLTLPRARGEPAGPRWLALVGALYLVLGGAYAVAWFVAPGIAVVAFVVLTWIHWGQGDVAHLVNGIGADHLRTRVERGLALVVRGGLPMVVPLLAAPDRYRAVLGLLLGLFGAPTGTVRWLVRPSTRLAIGVAFGAVVVGTLVLGGVRARSRTAWLADAGEVVLLWAYFSVVPPLVAVGTYFAWWHSVRHVGRLLALDPVGDGRLLPGLARFVRDAAPLTVAALGVAGGVALVVPRAPAALPGLVAVYLVTIAVLTLPHTAIVSWLDLEQGVWSPGTGGEDRGP